MRTSQPSPSAVFEAAVGYIERGWAVLPVEPGGKRPLIRWQRYQQRRPGRTQLEYWFRTWPNANIAVVTGAISGLVVLDVDPAHGGNRSLQFLEHRHGTLSPTPEVLTGGGGRHLYFRRPGWSVPNRVALMPGLDIRGDGGYVVAPPSRHPSGGYYVWRAGLSPDQCPLAALPDWLLEKSFRRSGHSLEHWRSLIHRGVAAGERNNTIASLTGHLLWHGVDPIVVLELMLSWNRVRCRPPLSDSEVVRTVESITRSHTHNSDD